MTEIWHAILSTRYGAPAVGERFLVDRPTADESRPAIGRIESVEKFDGGTMPTFILTISVVSEDVQEARAAVPIDVYSDRALAQAWWHLDENHFARHGYGRNHWT